MASWLHIGYTHTYLQETTHVYKLDRKLQLHKAPNLLKVSFEFAPQETIFPSSSLITLFLASVSFFLKKIVESITDDLVSFRLPGSGRFEFVQ